MLKTKIEHIYGSQEHHDLQIAKFTLDDSGIEFSEREAIENGWLIHNGEWYQCRSTRINIDKYLEKYTKPTLPKQDIVFFNNNELSEENKQDIDRIYKEYCEYKKFDTNFKLHVDENRSGWFIVYDNDIAVAFTKCIFYTVGGMESQYTAWNYHNPKLSIAKKLVYYEVNMAKKLTTSDYLYIGQGYETGSIYKADYPGFEWWTGSEWSTDIEKYKELCVRDSDINTLDDLTRVFNE